ncbi:MAG: TonB-dependent receptor domain-containing protein [Chloroflexota bacterium]
MKPIHEIKKAAATVVVSALFAGTAAAQSAVGVAKPKPNDPAPVSTSQLRPVTITGSRVITNGSDSPTPVTVVPIEQMTAIDPSGTVADQLNSLPQFAGSRGPLTNPGGGSQGTSSAASDPAANVLNLRNMGYTRTLILFDGHRVAPTGTDGTVDIDAIPQMLLKRVDIVTGGASAVYGSDAVTGVVNFVPDTTFKGLKVDASSGISHYGDDQTNEIGIAFGSDLFGSNAHFEGSFQFRKSNGVLFRSDRSFGVNRWTMENPSNGEYGPYLMEQFVTSTRSSFGGLILGGPLSNANFTQNGVLSPFLLGTPLGNQPYQAGGGGAYNNSTLAAPEEMGQLYLRFDDDLTNAFHVYAYITGNYNHSWQQAAADTLRTPNGSSNGAIALSSTDAFLPASVQQTLSAAGPTFEFGKTFSDIPASNVDSWERQWQAATGFTAALAHGYTWDGYYSHAQNDINERQNANLNTLKLVAALDAVVNPANGEAVCAVSLTEYGSLYPGCTPLDPFGPNAASQEAINYVGGATQFWAHTAMDDVTTTLRGAPLSTWDGPINMAVSAEWRRLGYDLIQSGLPNDPSDPISCAGLPSYDCKATTSAQTWEIEVSAPRSEVTQSVKEAAFEFNAPLIKNLKLIKEVSFNGAARWMDYSTSGTAWAWKGGIVWKVNGQLTFRATRSRDIRAPTLNDLYVPPSYSVYGGEDFLTGVTAFSPEIPFIAQGNAKLTPEIGNTQTAGLIYTPNWLPGFSLTVDAFKIDVSHAIQQFRGASNYVMTGCAESGGSSAFCQLIVRPISCCSAAVANTATELFTESLNLADQWTDGGDLEADYLTHVRNHPLDVRLLATFQPNLVYAAPGSAQFNMAGVAFANGALQATPVWRASLLARYSPFHNVTINARERWRSDLNWGPLFAPPQTYIFPMGKIAQVWYTDISMSYLLDESDSTLELYVSADNLFNRQPPAAAFYGNAVPGTFGGFALGDDPIGAYYTVGIRYRR